jgi:type IV pilus assembly protein PilW
MRRSQRNRTSSPAPESGFTLVELMIGMTIGLLLILSLTTLLVNNSRATTELDRSSRQIENGRYAMELLSDEISLAGYFGEIIARGADWTLPDACATSLADMGLQNAPLQLPVPLEGHEGTASDPPPACAADHREDTATLTLHRFATETTDVDAVSAGTSYVQTSRCKLDLPSTKLIHSDDEADFTLRNVSCDEVLPVRQYLSRVYYVANCSDCGNDLIPTLKRVDIVDGSTVVTPLAEGIEEVQFEYGFDTDDDGIPDNFLTAPDGVAGSASNRWSNVLSVRIWLVSRTTEQTRGWTDTKTYDLGPFGTRGPYNDGFKRRVYSMSVRLNNPAGWRE